ncbi:hypothetical protein [Chthonobacter albigriseus]|uniref:hypothetical protein n=1 Tax=Chthonobacter albigriseus TaxID=1683161 RepID=UPI0015EE9C4F|nr:hypothetical protein [Chthonobacter albigriseus]
MDDLIALFTARLIDAGPVVSFVLAMLSGRVGWAVLPALIMAGLTENHVAQHASDYQFSVAGLLATLTIYGVAAGAGLMMAKKNGWN